MTPNVQAPEARWFLDTLVHLHVAHEAFPDGLSLLESLAPRGDSPPLHVHHREDELFYVLDGDFTFRLGEALLERHAGEALLIPQGVPHTYRVDSDTGRWLVTTSHGDFEALVRNIGRPAGDRGLPEPHGPPSEEEQRALAAAALAVGIEVVGPPLH